MGEQVWPMVFNSNEEFGAYAAKHPEVYRSVSPGGAAAELSLSRQRVHQLFEAGVIRAWVIYDKQAGPCDVPPGCRASYIYISWEDVEAYKVSYRKPGPKPKIAA